MDRRDIFPVTLLAAVSALIGIKSHKNNQHNQRYQALLDSAVACVTREPVSNPPREYSTIDLSKLYLAAGRNPTSLAGLGYHADFNRGRISTMSPLLKLTYEDLERISKNCK